MFHGFLFNLEYAQSCQKARYYRLVSMYVYMVLSNKAHKWATMSCSNLSSWGDYWVCHTETIGWRNVVKGQKSVQSVQIVSGQI